MNEPEETCPSCGVVLTDENTPFEDWSYDEPFDYNEAGSGGRVVITLDADYCDDCYDKACEAMLKKAYEWAFPPGTPDLS